MIHEALLRALPDGGVMWLKAAGISLWPLLRDGDSLRVKRVLDVAGLVRGDVAVVKLPSGVLAAHLVVSLTPLRTASTAGVLDPEPLEALAFVTGFRRAGRVVPWPRASGLVLRWWPAAARLIKHVPGLKTVVRRARGR